MDPASDGDFQVEHGFQRVRKRVYAFNDDYPRLWHPHVFVTYAFRLLEVVDGHFCGPARTEVGQVLHQGSVVDNPRVIKVVLEHLVTIVVHVQRYDHDVG